MNHLHEHLALHPHRAAVVGRLLPGPELVEAAETVQLLLVVVVHLPRVHLLHATSVRARLVRDVPEHRLGRALKDARELDLVEVAAHLYARGG